MAASESQKEYMREYYRAHRERIRAHRKARYLDIREDEIARVQESKEKRKPRTSPQKKPSLTPARPPTRRRWSVIGEEIFFNSPLGYSATELSTALRDLQLSLSLREKWNLANLRARRRDHVRNLAPDHREWRKQLMAAKRKGETRPERAVRDPDAVKLRLIKRKWLVARTRIYFNPVTPLVMEEMLQAIGQLQSEIRAKSTRSAPARPAPAPSRGSRAREKNNA